MSRKNYFKIIFVGLFIVGFALFYYSFSRSNMIPLKVLFGSPSKSMPLISPDGKKLSYIAPIDGIRNIWIKTLGKNDDHPITDEKKQDITFCFWQYDNKHVFYMQDKHGDENYHLFRIHIEALEKEDLTPFKNVRTGLLSYEKHLPDEILIEMNKHDKKVFDAYKLDLKTNNLTMIAKNPGNVESWLVDWNNDVRGARTPREDGGYNGLVRDNKNSEWRKIATWDLEDGNSRFFSFSKDGTSIYAYDSRNYNTKRLVTIDTQTGDIKSIFNDPNYDFASVIKDQDTWKLQAGYYYKERKEWIFFDDTFKHDMREAMKLDYGDISLVGRDKEDKKWIVLFTKDNGPHAFWFFDRETKKGEFLFYDIPELKKYTLANMKPISFTSRDGLKIDGYVTCPVNKKSKNLPMVLFVHGGPSGRDNWRYNPEVQFFANRGYAVLQINFRGSSGYGKKFLNAGNKEWAANMHNDLVDAVEWAVTNGIADPKKIAIYGGSYGGYAALVGATFTPNLFCCAVDICGPANLVTLLKTTPPYWSTIKHTCKKRIGDLETEEEFLKSRSPIFKVNQIKIPVMVIQGANDPRVKTSEADQIVGAMKKNHVDYDYLLFKDEGHGIEKETNRLKMFSKIEKFLAKHLKG